MAKTKVEVKAEDYQVDSPDPAKDEFQNVDLSKVVRAMYTLENEIADIKGEIGGLRNLAKRAGYGSQALRLGLKWAGENKDDRDLVLSKANKLLQILGKPSVNINAGISHLDKGKV